MLDLLNKAQNKPDIHAWHAGFKRSVDLAEEGYRMPLLARHLAVDCGMTYPAVADIDHSFIKNLETPEGVMDYDQLFDKALQNVLAMWVVIGKAIFENDQEYLTKIGNWNLDTGKDENGNFAYWRNKAIEYA